MKQIFNQRLSGSSYGGKILSVLTGTLIAHAITILALPLLTRLYDIPAFGTLGIYIACANIARVCLTLRYDFAVQSAQKDDSAKAVLVLSGGLGLVGTLFVLFPLFLFVPFFFERFGGLLWVVPLMLFVSTIDNVLTVWINRRQKFREFSKSRILRSGSVVVLQSVFALHLSDSGGLLLGLLFGEVVAVLYLFYQGGGRDLVRRNISLNLISNVAYTYRDNPRYLLPGHLLNVFSAQAPILVVDTVFGAHMSGYVHMAQRIVSTPSQLIGAALFRVFFSEASKIFHRDGNCYALARKTFYLAAVVSLFFLSTIALGADLFAGALLGEEWERAVSTIWVFAFAELVPTAFYPISAMWMVADQQRLNLKYQVLRSILCLGGLFAGLMTGQYMWVITIYAIARAVAFSLFLKRCLSISKGDRVPSPVS